MRKIISAAAMLFCAALLCACSKAEVVYQRPADKSAITADRTVLIYMIGGSEESENGAASERLDDIMSVNYPESVNVIIETGGSARWHKQGLYSDYLQRFEAADNKLYLADQTMAETMCSSAALADFIKWGVSNYKANKYMLIISGKGGGSVYGIGGDELYPEDTLMPESIAYALSNAGVSFDIIGLDASLMGSLETAAAINTYADYLVAPQEAQSYDCWDYTGFLSRLAENPAMDGAEMGRAVCDSCYGKNPDSLGADYAAISVTDMSKISTLTQAFDGLAGDMLVSSDSFENYRNLAAALGGVYRYGGAEVAEGFSDLADLGDAAMRSRQYVGITADMLIDALNDAVIYRAYGGNQTRATGLSFYYPFDRDSDNLQYYMDTSLCGRYREFLHKTCISCSVSDDTPDYTSSWAWNDYNNDMAWLEYQTILDGSSYELYISGNMDLFNDVAVNVYKYDKNSGEYVFVGKHRKLDADWESGIFKDNFDGVLPLLNGENVSLSLAASYDDYDLYAAPVMADGKKSSIRVKYDRAADKYEITDIWSGLDGKGQTYGDFEQPAATGGAAPMLAAIDNEHNVKRYVVSGKQKKIGTGLQQGRTPDGEYIFEFEMTDIYGAKRWGTPVKAAISSGRISF